MVDFGTVASAFGGFKSELSGIYNVTRGVNGASDKIREKTPQISGSDEIDGSFASVFRSYMGLINETNSLQQSSEKLSLDFAAGKTDDMLAVSLASEKAYTSLNFTTQVTNKIIEAYREIMRIQL